MNGTVTVTRIRDTSTSSLLEALDIQSRLEMSGRCRFLYELRLTTRSGSASSDSCLSDMTDNTSPTSSPCGIGLLSMTGTTFNSSTVFIDVATLKNIASSRTLHSGFNVTVIRTKQRKHDISGTNNEMKYTHDVQYIIHLRRVYKLFFLINERFVQ